jgi:hypothetical protein
LASSSNARLDCNIVFISSSSLKNIYDSPRSESGQINCDFRKPFYPERTTELEPARPVWLQ